MIKNQPPFEPVQMVIVSDSAAACAAWNWGTVMYRDEDGHIVGAAYFTRISEYAAEMLITFDPKSVAALSAEAPASSLPQANA